MTTAPPVTTTPPRTALAGRTTARGGLLGVAQDLTLLLWPPAVAEDRFSYPLTPTRPPGTSSRRWASPCSTRCCWSAWWRCCGWPGLRHDWSAAAWSPRPSDSG